MNISTYESQIKALEAGGGGGSSDGLFMITLDVDNMTSDKTFSEVKNAVLNNTPILINLGSIILPDIIIYDGDENDISIQTTMYSIRPGTTPLGTIFFMVFRLSPNNVLTIGEQKGYTYEITEVNE